jgi:hypothetical protein
MVSEMSEAVNEIIAGAEQIVETSPPSAFPQRPNRRTTKT